ncbi:MAG TPA: hypothetical protein VLI92_04240 [Candidatus Saccharimonadales bacterium]|nr:hypothetical protein [Candidatus Saccharimonadales bacterium]
MNNSQVAKNGFKTFIVTLVVSLVLFSVLYYYLAGSTKDVDIENKDLHVAKNSTVAMVAPTAAPSAPSVTADDSTGPGDSAFAMLSQQKINSEGKTVLAASTESTGSVPVTGVTEITWGILLSVVALAFGCYLVFLGPRKAALKQFEKDITKDLD